MYALKDVNAPVVAWQGPGQRSHVLSSVLVQSVKAYVGVLQLSTTDSMFSPGSGTMCLRMELNYTAVPIRYLVIGNTTDFI